MSAATAALPVRALQEQFLADVLPLVQRQATRAFRCLPCSRREDVAADAVLHAWTDFLRLAERGLVETVPASSVAFYAIIRARSGRRPQGEPRGGGTADVMAWHIQRRHGFQVHGSAAVEEAGPASSVGRRGSVPEAVGLRVDFLRWAMTRPAREQLAMRALATGEHPVRLACRLGVTPSWISRARLLWRRSWRRFTR